MRDAEFGWQNTNNLGSLEFTYNVPKQIARLIIKAINTQFSVGDDYRLLALQTVINNPIGRYKLSTSTADYFVRVSSKLGISKLEQAITSYLVESHISVNAIVIGGITLWSKGIAYRVDIRTFIEGAHFNYSKEQFRNLCLTLRDCHLALLKFPLQSEIKRQADLRFTQIKRFFDTIEKHLKDGDIDIFAEHREWADKHKEFLHRLSCEFNPNFNLVADAQCLHGEIHLGNVLFKGQDAILIDFEEAVHTFASPNWDIAYLLQRFCFDDFNDAQTQKTFLNIAHEIFEFEASEVYHTMQQLSYFAMITLLYQRNISNIRAPLYEYEKFVGLELQARKLAGI